MKVLFLDVDGVLNSTRSAVVHRSYGFIGDHTSWQHLDQISVQLIRKACIETGTKIVLSSTWRKLATEQDIKSFSLFLGVEIVGVTPSNSDGFRGKEILNWLSDNPQVKKFVIVDDDSDMLPEQLPYFVKTQHENGLLFEHYKKIVELLD